MIISHDILLVKVKGITNIKQGREYERTENTQRRIKEVTGKHET
jgi:hypothetical protein